MKKTFSTFLTLFMVLSLVACGAPAAETTQSTTTEVHEVVTFADPLLEAMIRDVIGKPEGDITMEEAEAVVELELGIEWQQSPVEGTQIKDISGLENFTNLESLSLHFHAISDISPLSELTKLHSLSLGGNPVADITPLSGLTSLGWLTLFNCQAQDYTPLANLTGLGGLLMDHSSIRDVSMLSELTELGWLGLSNTQVSDVSPLSTLVNLKKLQLEGCPVTDYSPLAGIYPNLEESDFTIVSSLRELGFSPINNALQVESYKTEDMYIQVHHTTWGERDNKDEEDAVLLCKDFGTENEIMIIYYPDTSTYLILSHSKDFRYTFDSQNKTMNIEYGEENANLFMETVYDEVDPYPVMTPIKDFTKIMTDTFGVSADLLYHLPRETVEAPSLIALGFKAEKDYASCLYEQHEPWYYSIEVNNPEWGTLKDGGDVRFFTPFSDEYRIVVTYYVNEKKFVVGADDNDLGGASFEYFVETNAYNDIWCSDKEITVEQYFINAIDDPTVDDVYQYAIQLMPQYISDTFGMTIEELYALPVGE